MKHLTFSLSASSALILAGCNSPRENISEQATLWQNKSADFAAEVKVRAEETVRWDSARARMIECNLDVRSARQDIISADLAIDRVWLDILPATTLSYSIDRGLTDIAKGSNGQLSIFAFINVPGLISTRMRYYGAVLSKVRAQYAYELTVRQKTVQLWRAFRDSKRLQERRSWARMARERNLLSGADAGNAALAEYLSDYSLKREGDSQAASLGILLGDNSKKFLLSYEGLPILSYLDKPLDPADTKHVGLLTQKLTATELEGARLRKLGANLAFWPDVSVGISGPPLYSTGQSGSSFWSAKEARGFATASWNLGTNLSTLYNLNETERQVGLMRSRLIEAEKLRLRQLYDTQEALKAHKRRADDVDARLALLLSSPAAPSADLAAAWNGDLRAILEERRQLSSERDDFESAFWFMDDAKWADSEPDVFKDSDEKKNSEASNRLT
jgi:hypothetical protein